MHDVFISYSSTDKPIADAVCAALESTGVRCWMASRDILPGTDWNGAIVDAIAAARVMVLVFSASANASPQVRREVERAADREVTIVPFRIDPIEPAGSLEHFISTPHWLDALTRPVDQHLSRLTATVRSLLASPPGPAAAPAARPRPRTLVSVAPDDPGRSSTRTWLVLALVLAALFTAAAFGFREMILARNRPVTASVTLGTPTSAPSTTQPAAATAPTTRIVTTTTRAATDQTDDPTTPGNTFRAAVNRGRVALAQSDYTTAVEEFTAAIRLNPTSAEARIARAKAQEIRSRPDLALADLTDAVRLDPASVEARMLRGDAYITLGDDKDALADYSEAIRLAPRNSDAYLSRASVYAKEGDTARSRADFETANRLMANGEKQP